MSTRKNLESLIGKSSKKALKALKENKNYSYIRKTPVFFKDMVDEDIDTGYAFETIEKRIPEHLLSEVDIVYVGFFKKMESEQINAFYENGAIFITNKQDDEQDMIDDIVHELAHAVESRYQDVLYADGEMELEFLGKRKRLFSLLKSEYGTVISDWAKYFTDSDYSKEFDEFLYKVIGYPSLTAVSFGLFISPYGATSLREYYANGFEEYFLRDREYIKQISPILYNKIESLEEIKND